MYQIWYIGIFVFKFCSRRLLFLYFKRYVKIYNTPKRSVVVKTRMTDDEYSVTKIPSYKSLQSETEWLTSQQNELYAELKEKRSEAKRLQTVADNIDLTLHAESNKAKDQTQEI